MIVIIPKTFEALGPFLREELPKFVWQTACDSVIGGKIGRQLVGDRFRQWKIKTDAAELIKVEVRAGLSCRFKSGFRKFLISAQPSPNGTRIEIVETKSWGWLTVAVTLALLFFIVPGIFRIIGNIMWTRRNRFVLESVAAKICLLFPGTNVGDVASAPVTAIPKGSVIPPPPVPVGTPSPASIITVSAPPPPTLQGITSRPPPPPPTHVWALPPVPLQMAKTSTISSAEEVSQIDLNEPAEELPSTMPPPPQWAPPPISSEQIKAPPFGGREQNLADAPYASAQPSLFALHALKIILAVVALFSATALALAWPWISNEIHNAVPRSAQIADYISPLIEEKLDHSPAVKTDVSISKITKLGRGKAEAQVHVSVIAQEDFLDRVDFEDIAKARGYDAQGFDKATEDARSLPQAYAPATLSVPIPTLARITSPKGTQHDYDLLVTADREGKNWNFSLSPDQTTLSQIVNFSGTPRSSWASQPSIVDSDTGVQAVASIIEYRKSFVAAVDRAKTNYAQFQQEELQRKQSAATIPPSSASDNSNPTVAPSNGTSTISQGSPQSGISQTQTEPATSATIPTKEYPPKTIVQGKVALCLRGASMGQPDALLVDCIDPDKRSLLVQGTVMLIGFPDAATYKVGDDVDVVADFVSVVTLALPGGKSVTAPQYRFPAALGQIPHAQHNVEAQSTPFVDAANKPPEAPQESPPADKKASITFLPADDIGGNSYKGRGHIYSIPDLSSLVGKNVGDAWLYGSFLLFSQDGSKAMCHPKTAWSLQSNEVDIDFDQLTFSAAIWQGIANQEKALAIYESGNVDAYINYANQNPGLAVLFVAKKNRPLRLLRVYRQADGKLVALTKSPGGIRMGDGTASNSTANASPTPDPNAVPSGILIPENPGFVRSPYAPNQPPVDVRGYASGTQVRCPYTNKIFTIP